MKQKPSVKFEEGASAGHRLGQLIGDWWEEFFVLPLLREVGRRLGLFLDSRFVARTELRAAEKILWPDEFGNNVDYDFVFELDGTPLKAGVPVAFIECCWRRGARHSKDKARDDSGKLLPMRTAYPTARYLGMVVSGDFTEPARELVRSRGIDLFYVPKEKVVAAFAEHGLTIDYDDRLRETKKAAVAEKFERR